MSGMIVGRTMRVGLTGETASMASREIVVVGASAGGVEALRAFVSALPRDLPAAVLVVLHLPRSSASALHKILSRSGPLPAGQAADGEAVRPGCVYVAPPDHHLLLRDGSVALTRGPQENGHRPAIDPLFRSAARHYGPRAVGVILSGTLDDGASGLAAIARRGGTAAVQDPAEALYPGMPVAALEQVPTAFVARAAELARTVAS